MRVTAGKIVDGKVVFEGESFREGLTVTVLAPDDEATFDLNADDEEALLASMRELDGGGGIDGGEFLKRLAHHDET